MLVYAGILGREDEEGMEERRMKLIERIKEQLELTGVIFKSNDIAALVAYYEATEGWLFSSRHTGPEWDRLQAARAALEKEE